MRGATIGEGYRFDYSRLRGDDEKRYVSYANFCREVLARYRLDGALRLGLMRECGFPGWQLTGLETYGILSFKVPPPPSRQST